MMKVLLVNHEEVLRYLPMDECIDVMERALRAMNEGKTLNPLRTGLWLPDKRGLLGVMTSSTGIPFVSPLLCASNLSFASFSQIA